MASTLFSANETTQEPYLSASAAPHTTASRIAVHAVQALIDEANLTPKPALVDRRGNGAHTDLTLPLMHRSARALLPCFEAIASASERAEPSAQLREQLGAIGRMGESLMFAATNGANSHKGAIWSLGLLVAGTALCSDARDPYAIASAASNIAHFPDASAAHMITHGARAQQIYGTTGARGEAQQGFPHVVHAGFPALLQARLRGVPEDRARLDALMAIMAELEDTCLLHRGGLAALLGAQSGARLVLREGGTSTVRGWACLLELDAELLQMNASPGGSADLLAATLFVDSITNASIVQRIIGNSVGDVELWKN